MKYGSLPKEIRQIVKNEFVFVSYSHKNLEVYNRVKSLVQFLRNRNIPVVYDEGGLKPGMELTQFENLILDEKCKYVLVVCDKAYIDKINNNTGGAWREYFNISNDYPFIREKYIPLIVDAKIPLFSGKVYINFTDDTKNTFEQIEKAIEELKITKNTRSNVDSLLKEASQLCESQSYRAANKKIDDAINLYQSQMKTTKSKWAELYNLKLYICIFKNDVDSAICFAEKLLTSIGEKFDLEKKAIYFTNCALAYRMKDRSCDEYVECAKEAYNAAKKYGSDEVYYYSCMYATALYEAEQYKNAYKIIKDALKEFYYWRNDATMYNKDDYIMLIKIKGNIAEIATACSSNICQNQRKKLEFLEEANKHIIELLCLKEIEEDDAIRAEVYSIAILVFDALKRFYSSK